MERHFIESCEDEREVLRKIAELKKMGFTEADMFVIARSSEQLTRIRTRTDVEYHAAEGRGMGRVAIFFSGGPHGAHFSGMADETKEIAYFYQQLIEGRLLLFCNKGGEDMEFDWRASESGKGGRDPAVYAVSQLEKQWNEEERIFIDSIHYESFLPMQAEPIHDRPKPNRKKKK